VPAGANAGTRYDGFSNYTEWTDSVAGDDLVAGDDRAVALLGATFPGRTATRDRLPVCS
jgi:hypothetical protein